MGQKECDTICTIAVERHSASTRTAQPAVPADRFAHEIGAILGGGSAARLRLLNGKPLGGNPSVPFHVYSRLMV
jgi:hypothetical protein